MAPQALKWLKKGRIVKAEGQRPWMQTHTQNPTPVLLEDRVRVYFNTRPPAENGLSVSLPAYVDLALADPTQVLALSEEPVLGHGDLGCFDQHGCMCSSVVSRGKELWMYYVGWKRCSAVPYDWAIGLAISRDGGEHFQRAFPGPVIGSSKDEPYLQNGCYVMRMGGEWHIWYSTGKAWLVDAGKAESRYTLTHATSADGIEWRRTGQALVAQCVEDETQTTPTVFKQYGYYHMLFSYRHSVDFRNAARGYRLGYAWSDDLQVWHRDDALAGIDLSSSGWDSQMVCYPQVCRVHDNMYLFYCGNDFGREGLGVAVLADENEEVETFE